MTRSHRPRPPLADVRRARLQTGSVGAGRGRAGRPRPRRWENRGGLPGPCPPLRWEGGPSRSRGSRGGVLAGGACSVSKRKRTAAATRVSGRAGGRDLGEPLGDGEPCAGSSVPRGEHRIRKGARTPPRGAGQVWCVRPLGEKAAVEVSESVWEIPRSQGVGQSQVFKRSRRRVRSFGTRKTAPCTGGDAIAAHERPGRASGRERRPSGRPVAETLRAAG